MSLDRNRLPQLSDNLFVSDGGLETDLNFHDGYQLPPERSLRVAR